MYIHPGSVLARQRPQYIVYQYIDETSHMYMKGGTQCSSSHVSVFMIEFTAAFFPSFPSCFPPPLYLFIQSSHLRCGAPLVPSSLVFERPSSCYHCRLLHPAWLFSVLLVRLGLYKSQYLPSLRPSICSHPSLHNNYKFS